MKRAISILCLTIFVGLAFFVEAYENNKVEDEIVEAETTEMQEVATVNEYTLSDILLTEIDIKVDEPEIVCEPQFSESDLDYLAHCVFAEAGNQSYMGKVYVVDCILNRYNSGNFDTLTQVINKKGQFECVLNGSINRVEPDEETYRAIEQELKCITNTEIKYFRTNHYHKFGTPMFKEGDHYFSGE